MGVDTERFRPATGPLELRQRLGEGPIILFVGRLAENSAFAISSKPCPPS